MIMQVYEDSVIEEAQRQSKECDRQTRPTAWNWSSERLVFMLFLSKAVRPQSASLSGGAVAILRTPSGLFSGRNFERFCERFDADLRVHLVREVHRAVLHHHRDRLDRFDVFNRISGDEHKIGEFASLD